MTKTLHGTSLRSERVRSSPFRLLSRWRHGKLKLELRTATTDEVHDLEAVFVLDYRRAPVAATHYDAIQLDGNSRDREVKLSD